MNPKVAFGAIVVGKEIRLAMVSGSFRQVW